MGDKTEILLQKVLDENRCLRETMEARDAENKRLLEELTLNLNNSTSGKRSRTRKRNMCISKQCRVSICEPFISEIEEENVAVGYKFKSHGVLILCRHLL